MNCGPLPPFSLPCWPITGRPGRLCRCFKPVVVLARDPSLQNEIFMIEIHKHQLANGLRVVVHPDLTTPLAAVNLLYDVGSRDEDPSRTAFAYLFVNRTLGGRV